MVAVPMDVDLPPAPPLLEILLGMRWVFTGGFYEVERAPPLLVEDQERPPAAVPPRGNSLPTQLEIDMFRNRLVLHPHQDCILWNHSISILDACLLNR